ncbi:MAG: Cbb3-type cytochrome c oxidase subunit II/cytochrome c [Candidatus Methanohalarchaeum thermophilum]|uniref:Cbb3-type cytochrome c oxidase subunit II/cytochrome c n=1 Tax=Methanohalarchaeum thermophilum TaxID=1903181 RepID=A0A1Q6DU78_METT1|nr:MAG: Cbb3-type cytochrome c oxidase subunit II/cytochrome c [Candidatus Methanohalarchaeum thermophilum]
MKKGFIAFGLLIIFLLPLATAAVDFEEGKEIYEDDCLSCHGPEGAAKKGAAVDFSSQNYWDKTTEEEVKQIIKNGKNGMPAFDLTSEENEKLVEYMKAMAKNELTQRNMLILHGITLALLLIFPAYFHFDSLKTCLASSLILSASAILGFITIIGPLQFFTIFNTIVLLITVIFAILSIKQNEWVKKNYLKVLRPIVLVLFIYGLTLVFT